MLFVCEQYGQWSAPEGCYEPVLSSGESRTWRRCWAAPWRCSCVTEQYELRARVGERDGLLPVSRGEGRVQHGVGGAALGTRGEDGMRRVHAQPVPRGGGERGDVGGDGQHGDGAVLTACGAR